MVPRYSNWLSNERTPVHPAEAVAMELLVGVQILLLMNTTVEEL